MFNAVNAEIDAEIERKTEIARQAEIARHAEIERQIEIARQAEIERQIEIERQAEKARQARKKDLTNQLNQAEAKVLRLQKELIATTENVSRIQSELATM
jgi:UDP-3-O-[3-hydroxymyristoyl] glucosamine N-acyltransferase